MRPERLQGTDGIRARVDLDAEHSDNQNPIEFFLSQLAITPAFVELYCFTFSQYLKAVLNKEKLTIGLGWDPRDSKEILPQAALRGLQKSGATVAVLGMCPTPLVPIFQISRKLDGGVMITASHNPPDQNGIKLFAGKLAAKFFPQDDRLFTARLYQEDWLVLQNRVPVGTIKDCQDEAKLVWQDFHEDSRNSWLTEIKDFSDRLLIVDHANGSLRTAVTQDIWQALGFLKVIDVHEGSDRPVNQHCGAAEIEGCAGISREEFESSPKWQQNPFLKTMFDYGTTHREPALQGRVLITGAVFDGDGDRYLRVDFDPYLDCVRILSGDEICYHLAHFHANNAAHKTVITTVESDLSVAQAMTQLGFHCDITGVGDKWLLLQAILSLLRQKSAFKHFHEDIHSLLLELAICPRQETLTAIENLLNTEDDCSVFTDLEFQLGGEESGHTITPGIVTDGSGQLRIVFAGNGLKAFFNTLAATEVYWQQLKGTAEFFNRLHRPFKPGYKKTFYVYYTDRQKLSNPSIRKELIHTIHDEIQQRFQTGYQVAQVDKSEEPDMIYFEISPAAGSFPQAIVFVRNSGTEEKTGVYVRGTPDLKPLLESIGQNIRQTIMTKMMNNESPYFHAEIEFLKSGVITNSQINPVRLHGEMHKSGLIDEQQQPTQLGRWLKLGI